MDTDRSGTLEVRELYRLGGNITRKGIGLDTDRSGTLEARELYMLGGNITRKGDLFGYRQKRYTRSQRTLHVRGKYKKVEGLF